MKISIARLKEIIVEEVTNTPTTEAQMEFSDAEIAHQRTAIADMDVGIAREFAQDVVEYVRQEIVSEQAPALAGMSMGDFLRLAAEIADDEPMAEVLRISK
tara:strand:- start:1379 stop:1681 length:303 start_codon:yes stop_codon:yes gene_type:complete